METTDVTIVLTGVRIERLPRLHTLLKSEVFRFASKMDVDDGQPPEPKPKKRFARK